MSIQENHPKSARAKRQPAANNHSASESVVQPSMRQHWTDAADLPLLPDEQPVSTVRDSLYDLIPLGPREGCYYYDYGNVWRTLSASVTCFSAANCAEKTWRTMPCLS